MIQMKNNTFYKIMFFFSFLNTVVILESCATRCVTVWVHGTHPAQRLLSSLHSPVRSHVYTKKGLSLAKELPANYNFRRIAQECCCRNPQEYDLDNFYTYGWHSAKLSSRHRKQVGEKLYDELKELLRNKQVSKLRLIGFSHGANVVINSLSHLPFDNPDMEVEVILIGMPVQESNKHNINNEFVTKTYSLYSKGDWIQRLDPQKLHSLAPKHAPVLSGRTFDASSNVIQVCMTQRGKSFGHIKFRSFLKYLPDIIKQVDEKLEHSKDKKHVDVDIK